jgi:hypothetical protein
MGVDVRDIILSRGDLVSRLKLFTHRVFTRNSRMRMSQKGGHNRGRKIKTVLETSRMEVEGS